MHFNVTIRINGQNFRSIEDVIRYFLMWLRDNYPSVISSLAVSGTGRMLWRIFIGNPFSVGSCRYRTLATYRNYDFQNVFFSFAEGRYIKSVTVILVRDIYIALWSLLFIIPGIIKSYSYFMVPYIIAENPSVSRERAFEISQRATNGEKLNMFLLDLSFLGWYLLGAMCLGIGTLFVVPYHYAAKTELYGALRFKSVKEGICRRDEIGSELFN